LEPITSNGRRAAGKEEEGEEDFVYIGGKGKYFDAPG
jgi:hypothetical protein